MIASLLIMLREGLEASLVVSILVAYLVKTERRALLGRIWLGVGAAVALSLVFGAVLTFGPTELDDSAAEAFTGVLSLLAVALVTWMIFWMATAGRRLAGNLRAAMDEAISGGGRWALALVAFVAVAREGLETALFLWAQFRSAGSDAGSLVGAVLGLGLAIGIAWALYRGSVRINLATFFSWTGGLLVIIAAGVLAYAVHELQESGVVPGEDHLLFDLTSTIAANNPVAVLVRGFFNLRPAMSVLEFGAWAAYVVVVGTLFVWRVTRAHRPVKAAVPAAS